MDPEVGRSTEVMEKINTWMLAQFAAFTSMLEAEEGQGMVEYGLILVLVSVVVIGVLTTVGVNLTAVFTAVGAALGGA
jgi:pilus assembly protein Flp/PilA